MNRRGLGALVLAARCGLLALALAGCAYPTTQMEPVVRRGERFDADVTAALERGDFAEAYRLCDGWLELARQSGTMVNLVAGHETILWIHWAERDLPGALVENDAMGQWARRAVGEQQRMGLMHYWWSRAWLLAEAGRHAEAGAANAELDRVSTQAGDRSSLPLMRAWLACQRGDLAAAGAALAGFDVDGDDDPPDLYLIARIRQAEGDAAGAERLRRRIRDGARTRSRAVVMQRMAHDSV